MLDDLAHVPEERHKDERGRSEFHQPIDRTKPAELRLLRLAQDRQAHENQDYRDQHGRQHGRAPRRRDEEQNIPLH